MSAVATYKSVRRLHLVMVLALSCLSFLGLGQASSIKSGQAAYYINPAQVNGVIDLPGKELSIEYVDKYGVEDVIRLVILKMSNETLVDIRLKKELGANFYNIPLESYKDSWDYDTVYKAILKDDLGESQQFLFNIPEPLEHERPELEILVKPTDLDCKGIENTTEYYVDVSKGRAPYKVKWYVLNEENTQLLYQPKTELLYSDQESSMIIIDHALGYNVVAHVIDACGMEHQEMVRLACENGAKKINSLLFQKINTKDGSADGL